MSLKYFNVVLKRKLCLCRMLHSKKFGEHLLKRYFVYSAVTCGRKYSSVLGLNSLSLNTGQEINRSTLTCSSVARSELNDEDDSSTIGDELEGKFEESSALLRNFLHPDSEDELINKLKQCYSIQDVFDLISDRISTLTHQQCSQCVVTLWDVQRICYTQEFPLHFDRESSDLCKTFLAQLSTHETFVRFLDQIRCTYHDMSADELSCLILYLNRMGISLDTELIQCLIRKNDFFISNTNPGEYPLTALSRFVLAVGGINTQNLWCKLLLVNALPHLLYWIDNCNTVLDYKFVTLTTNTMRSIVTQNVLDRYHKLTLKMLDSKQLEQEEEKLYITKAVMLFSNTSYAGNNPKSVHQFNTVRQLLHLLANDKDILRTFGGFYVLQKLYLSYLEPVILREKLRESFNDWLVNIVDESNMNAELLFCVTVNTPQRKKHHLAGIANSMIEKTTSIQELGSLTFNYMRGLSYDRGKLWAKILAIISKEYSASILFWIITRYVDQMRSYRSEIVEEKLLDLLFAELENRGGGLHPSNLAVASVFTLSCLDRMKNNRLIGLCMQKCLDNANQFSILDCLAVSKGFFSLFRKSVGSKYIQHFLKIDSALNARTSEILNQNPDLSLNDINMLVRSYINRKGATDSLLFLKLVQRFRSVKLEDVSSRLMKSIIYSLTNTNCYVPEILDLFCDYIVENDSDLLGMTVSKLLYAVYLLGHTPKNEQFFNVATEIITRDMDVMSCMGLLQAALSLSYYNYLTEPIVKFIFTIEFLDDVDNEIKHAFFKVKYPARVKKCLMELNRSVCLDYPAADIPWFHAKFCQQDAEQDKKWRSPFTMDVHETLISLTKDRRLVQSDVSSSYGHRIDFLLCLDKENNFIPFRKGTEPHSKIAVILNTESDYTIFEKRLKGPAQMLKRHLEILGYRLIVLEKSIWNSMFMTEPKAKKNYLNSVISRIS